MCLNPSGEVPLPRMQAEGVGGFIPRLLAFTGTSWLSANKSLLKVYDLLENVLERSNIMSAGNEEGVIELPGAGGDTCVCVN